MLSLGDTDLLWALADLSALGEAGGAMIATPPRRRDAYTQRGRGPWLIDLGPQRRFLRLIGSGAALYGLAAVLESVGRPPSTLLDVVSVLSGVLLGLGLFGMAGEITSRCTVQHCPQCLKGMTAGAIACPWCGKREEERLRRNLAVGHTA